MNSFFTISDELGFGHVLVYDHIIGTERKQESDFHPYGIDDEFHEVLTLLAFAAGITSNLDLVSGVLVLPQRQTVLVAKQAAQVDLMSNGRLRLGVGIGWNSHEYRALDSDFSDRASRYSGQISLLRSLWTEPLVPFGVDGQLSFGGRLAPPPVQQPIPIWLGGGRTGNLRVFERIGRLADGWIPNLFPAGGGEYSLADQESGLRQGMAAIAKAALEADRNPEDIGLHGFVDLGKAGDTSEVRSQLQFWRELGADHVSIRTLNRGVRGTGHVDMLGTLATELGL